MSEPPPLQRFIDAQSAVYKTVLLELQSGCKQSHWMWFIFPQLAELGRSPTAKFYGICSFDEAKAYLAHPLLGPRLRTCVEALLPWAQRRSALQILGETDSLKLRSSVTLFDLVEPAGRFLTAINLFFEGERDELTLALLNAER
jgi:uncharacterized protein (DUF1810 family)